MTENEYQMYLVDRIYQILPGQKLRDKLVVINDPNYIQGIPDLTVFFRPTTRFAMLEVKTSEKSAERPNQRWYIETWGESIFTSFIYPENEVEVLNAMARQLEG